MNCEVIGYKINIQKSVAFWYTNNEVSEREIEEIIPFTIIKKNQIPKKKNQGGERPLVWKPWDADEGNWRCKWMERYPAFMDWKNIVKIFTVPPINLPI